MVIYKLFSYWALHFTRNKNPWYKEGKDDLYLLWFFAWYKVITFALAVPAMWRLLDMNLSQINDENLAFYLTGIAALWMNVEYFLVFKGRKYEVFYTEVEAWTSSKRRRVTIIFFLVWAVWASLSWLIYLL